MDSNDENIIVNVKLMEDLDRKNSSTQTFFCAPYIIKKFTPKTLVFQIHSTIQHQLHYTGVTSTMSWTLTESTITLASEGLSGEAVLISHSFTGSSETLCHIRSSTSFEQYKQIIFPFLLSSPNPPPPPSPPKPGVVLSCWASCALLPPVDHVYELLLSLLRSSEAGLLSVSSTSLSHCLCTKESLQLDVNMNIYIFDSCIILTLWMWI